MHRWIPGEFFIFRPLDTQHWCLHCYFKGQQNSINIFRRCSSPTCFFIHFTYRNSVGFIAIFNKLLEIKQSVIADYWIPYCLRTPSHYVYWKRKKKELNCCLIHPVVCTSIISGLALDVKLPGWKSVLLWSW